MEERCASRAQRPVYGARLRAQPARLRFGGRTPRRRVLAQHQGDRRAAQRSLARPDRGREPAPGHASGEAKPVDEIGLIVRDAGGEHFALPGAGGNFVAVELLDDHGKSLGTLQLLFARNVLPVQEETHEIGGADWFDLGAQAVERIAVNAREEPAVAPFELGGAGRARRSRCKSAAQQLAFVFQREQRPVDERGIGKP